MKQESCCACNCNTHCMDPTCPLIFAWTTLSPFTILSSRISQPSGIGYFSLLLLFSSCMQDKALRARQQHVQTKIEGADKVGANKQMLQTGRVLYKLRHVFVQLVNYICPKIAEACLPLLASLSLCHVHQFSIIFTDITYNCVYNFNKIPWLPLMWMVRFVTFVHKDFFPDKYWVVSMWIGQGKECLHQRR